MNVYDLDLPLVHRGKVRESYRTPQGTLLMVASDRISAFDFVLEPTVPDKGKVLTQLSLWWFDQFGDIIDNHVISVDVPDSVAGRAIECEQLQMVPVECVARGYLTGSGWAEYQQTQTVCGIQLPDGLTDGARLPEPIFTPATKAELGEHDENIDFETMCRTTGIELGTKLREMTLAIYVRAEQIARARGIILADTKFEFGQRPDATLVLADEVLTPDSSRFWDADDWADALSEDRGPKSFDKQFVRDWLTRESGWQKTSGEQPPRLPETVVASTRARYVEAFEKLTGRPFRA